MAESDSMYHSKMLTSSSSGMPGMHPWFRSGGQVIHGLSAPNHRPRSRAGLAFSVEVLQVVPGEPGGSPQVKEIFVQQSKVRISAVLPVSLAAVLGLPKDKVQGVLFVREERNAQLFEGYRDVFVCPRSKN